MSISHEIRDGIAVITMDDDARRNTLSRRQVRGMLEAIAASDAARAIVIAARGKVYSAGADLSDFGGEGGVMDESAKETPMALFETLIAEPRIVIAAVHAGAYGGGFELTLCCDLVAAAPEAFFMLPETAHGVMPPIAAARLPAIIGTRRTLELIATRRKLSAAEAHALGLVNRLSEPGQALEAALALAHEVVDAAPPASLAAAKYGIADRIPALAPVLTSTLARLDEREWKEGMRAFAEKRKADYAPIWKTRRR
jgi:enoyl-CoA hydratase/carnithine racemase